MKYIASIIAAVVLFSALAVVAQAQPAGQAASVQSLQRKVSALRKANAKLRRKLATANNTISQTQAALDQANASNYTLSAQLTQANTDKAALQGQVTNLSGQVNALQGQVASLQSGVPGAVGTIARQGNLTNLVNLVLNPARQNWTCGGDVFIGQTFVSYDFNRPPYC